MDIWVSNAGVYPQYSIIDTPENVWDKTVDTNMKSVYLGARIAYRGHEGPGRRDAAGLLLCGGVPLCGQRRVCRHQVRRTAPW